MKAELKGLFSPDIDNLESFRPDEPNNFSFLLQVMAAPRGSEGEESFDIEVCTPSWLAETYAPDGIIVGRHYMIVQQYNYRKLVQRIENIIAQCSGENWEEVAAKISRYGRWEFEDYQDYKPGQ
jgi:immunity protein 8 of polymorphic toxin system